jgi:hypothetical protein
MSVHSGAADLNSSTRAGRAVSASDLEGKRPRRTVLRRWGHRDASRLTRRSHPKRKTKRPMRFSKPKTTLATSKSSRPAPSGSLAGASAPHPRRHVPDGGPRSDSRRRWALPQSPKIEGTSRRATRQLAPGHRAQDPKPMPAYSPIRHERGQGSASSTVAVVTASASAPGALKAAQRVTGRSAGRARDTAARPARRGVDQRHCRRPVCGREVRRGRHDVDPGAAHAPRTHGPYVESDRHPVSCLAEDVKSAPAVDDAVQQAAIRRDHDLAWPGHIRGASASSGWGADRGRRCRRPPCPKFVRCAAREQESKNSESGKESAHIPGTPLPPAGFRLRMCPPHPRVGGGRRPAVLRGTRQ